MSIETKDYILEEMRSIDSSIKEVESKINDLDRTLVEYRVSFQHHTALDENMYAELRRMNDILAQNTESLKVHIRRTELLEEVAVKLGARLTDLEIKQIQETAVRNWISSNGRFIGKTIAGIAATIGALAALPSAINWLKHFINKI